jgi:hypothetical protein
VQWRESDANTGANRDGNGHANRNGHSDSNTNRDGHRNRDANSDSYTNRDSDGYSDSYADSNASARLLPVDQPIVGNGSAWRWNGYLQCDYYPNRGFRPGAHHVSKRLAIRSHRNFYAQSRDWFVRYADGDRFQVSHERNLSIHGNRIRWQPDSHAYGQRDADK